MATAKITSIDSFGRVVIEFNTNMNINFNHSFINSTNMDLYLVSPLYIRERDDFDPKLTNFTWKLE